MFPMGPRIIPIFPKPIRINPSQILGGQEIGLVGAVNAGVEDRLYANRRYLGGAHHHILSLGGLQGDANKAGGVCFWDQFAAVPLLKILDAGKPNFFAVAASQHQVHSKFVGGSSHRTMDAVPGGGF